MSEPTRPLRHLARLVARLQAATAAHDRPTIPEQTGPSIWEPIHLGVDEYGHQVSITLAYRNLLIAGEPGAGKSVGLNNVVAHAALSLDADLWLFDGKLVELGLWRSCAQWFVGNDLDHALRALAALTVEMDRRYDLLDTCLLYTSDAADE